MRNISKVVFTFALLAFSAYPMGAGAEMGGRQCASDIQKFCKDVTPGQGRIIQCLKSHQNELSDDCKQAIAQKKARPKHRKSAPGTSESS
jgi:hypothetical protein